MKHYLSFFLFATLIFVHGKSTECNAQILVSETNSSKKYQRFDVVALVDSLEHLRFNLNNISLTPGPTGPPGQQGIQGPAGHNGFNALIKSTPEEVGANCPHSGTKIETGLDVNGNGVLDAEEIEPSQVSYICNCSSNDASLPSGLSQGELLYWNGSSWVSLAPGVTGQGLNMCYGTPQWGPCKARIITSPVTNITGLTAQSGGQVTDDGGNTVTARGICWDVIPNPDLTDGFTSDGIGVGIYSSTITNISPNTTYYVRSYATNAGGTTFGNQQEFLSGAALPTVVTGTATNISFDRASISGDVVSDGGATVSQRGICYGISANPTIADSVIASGSGPGSFISHITGLSGNTTYFTRAFAINNTGVNYGSLVSFVTLQTPSPQSCEGWGGPPITSSLMGLNGYIEAITNQEIDLFMDDNFSPMMSCGCSYFSNPSEASATSSNCAPGDFISETITFGQPGVYSVQGRNGDCIATTTCTINIVVR